MGRNASAPSQGLRTSALRPSGILSTANTDLCSTPRCRHRDSNQSWHSASAGLKICMKGGTKSRCRGCFPITAARVRRLFARFHESAAGRPLWAFGEMVRRMVAAIRRIDVGGRGNRNSGDSAHDCGTVGVALVPSQAGQASNADYLGGIEWFCQDVPGPQVEGFRPQVLIGHSGGHYQQGRIGQGDEPQQQVLPGSRRPIAVAQDDRNRVQPQVFQG